MLKLKRNFSAFETSQNSSNNSVSNSNPPFTNLHNDHSSLTNNSFEKAERSTKRYKNNNFVKDHATIESMNESFVKILQRRRKEIKTSANNKPCGSSLRVQHFPPSGEIKDLETVDTFIGNYKNQRKMYRKQLKMMNDQTSNDDANVLTSVSNCESNTVSSNDGVNKSESPVKRMFTENEVKLILNYREEQLRESYEKILTDLLQDQFNQFAKFNQDYISRQFNSRDFSYAS